MIKASFYCSIYDNDNVIDEDFCFDEYIAESQQELDEYIEKSNYKVNKICGYWGDNVGILKDIVIDNI